MGVDAIIHTASPFPMTPPKTEDELIRPAVDGMLRALRAAKSAGVGRVIITSSTVAITGSALAAGKTAYDEDSWTDVNAPSTSAYGKSKTLAEKAAWDFVKTEAPEIKLTSINPGFVVGAPLDSDFGTSVAVIERVLRAKDPMVPQIGFATVDVKDVARLHVQALEDDNTAGQRFLAVDRFLWFVDIAKAIKAAHPKRRVVTRVAPNFIVKVLGLFDPAIRGIIPDLGRHSPTDNSRARTLLGEEFLDVRESVVSTADYLIDNDLI